MPKRNNPLVFDKPVDHNGRLGFLQPDGSIRMRGGEWLFKPPYPETQAASIVTSEQGRAMAERRKSLAQQRAQEGMILGMGLDLTKASGEDAWRDITRAFVEKFRQSDSIRGMAEAYGKLGQAGGFIKAEENEKGGVVLMVLELFKRLEGEVVDGEVKEVK